MRQSMNVHLRSKTSKLMIMMLDPIATVPRVAEAIILDNLTTILGGWAMLFLYLSFSQKHAFID